jgi:hypothetical protein
MERNTVNKILFFAICVLIFAGSANGAQGVARAKVSNARVVSTFRYRTNLGYANLFKLEVAKDRGVWINGRKLSLGEMMLAGRSLQHALRVTGKPEAPGAGCPAGTFKHSVQKDRQAANVERGCLDGARFQSLLKTYRRIEAADVTGQI